MSPSLSDLGRSIGASPTMAVGGQAGRHPAPIHLAIGELVASPPECALAAATEFITKGSLGYGAPAGLPELREAIARDQTEKNGFDVGAQEVIVTHGGKCALHDALRAVIDPGDEVMIFAPYWPTFIQQVELLGGRPIIVPPRADGRVDLERAERAVSTHTRAIIVNSPNNPTSQCWNRSEILALAALAERADAWVICDQVYHDLVISGAASTVLRTAPELRERTIVIESFSKRFAMAGMRLGAAIGPEPVIESMISQATATTTHANLPAQHAGWAALRSGQEWRAATLALLRENRDTICAGCRDLEGLRFEEPESLFLFLDLRGITEDDLTVARRLRDESGVVVTPGSMFGAPGHLRLSLGVPTEQMTEATRRIRAFFC